VGRRKKDVTRGRVEGVGSPIKESLRKERLRKESLRK
jgi:hypothetical protein